jgi:hypothetical protein
MQPGFFKLRLGKCVVYFSFRKNKIILVKYQLYNYYGIYLFGCDVSVQDCAELAMHALLVEFNIADL